MKLLVVYASTDGHTRKIARFAADWSADSGDTVELLPFDGAEDVDLKRFDAAILAGSIHAGGYQKPLTEFCAERAGELSKLPTLFLSVSLSAAGHDADDWKGLDRILSEFTEATGWTPGRSEQIAGAYRPSQYDIFRRFIMRQILAAKETGLDLSKDHEFTDWDALAEVLEDWTDGLSSGSAAGSSAWDDAAAY